MDSTRNWRHARVFTIGHSTRTVDELTAMLRSFGVTVVVDIRTIPRSRHNPQFERAALRSALRRQDIGYVPISELGGLRKARKDSPNGGWRNASFRGYADYMLTEDFEAGLEQLRALVAERKVALMCAEAVPWRCHRSLVADVLTVRGARVEHISGIERASAHRVTRFAEIDGTRVTYPSADTARLETRGPFHLEATVRVLQRRPSNLVDVWEQEKYLRVLAIGETNALVEVSNRGTLDRPELRFTVLRSATPDYKLAPLEKALRRVLGLDVDPRPLARAAKKDDRLVSTALALRGMRPPRFAGLFDAFLNVVPFQQVSLDAGVATVNRLVTRFGETIEHGGRVFHCLPSPEIVAEARTDSLRRCGLSHMKAQTLRSIARSVASGELTEAPLASMSREEAIRLLCELPGIGPWSAGLVLLRGLGRLDVFPSGDVGAARGLRTLAGVRPASSIEPILEKFGEYRGYLYFCSLGASLVARGLIHPAPPPKRKPGRTSQAG